MSFVYELAAFSRYTAHTAVREVTMAVTERYARKVLRVKRNAPLLFDHLRLKCIGSKRWRQAQLRGEP